MENLVHIGLINGLIAILLAFVVAAITSLCRRRPAVVHGLWILVLMKFLVPSIYPIEIPFWHTSPGPGPDPSHIEVNENSGPNILAENGPSASIMPLPAGSSNATPSPPIIELAPTDSDLQMAKPT